MPNAFGDDARFSGSGTGDYEERTFAVFHGAALLSVEGGKTFPRGRHGHETNMIAELRVERLRFSFALALGIAHSAQVN
jgi:hypothetical protein